MRLLAELELRGPAGEPVDLRRTLLSHGVAALPPAGPRSSSSANGLIRRR